MVIFIAYRLLHSAVLSFIANKSTDSDNLTLTIALLKRGRWLKTRANLVRPEQTDKKERPDRVDQ